MELANDQLGQAFASVVRSSHAAEGARVVEPSPFGVHAFTRFDECLRSGLVGTGALERSCGGRTPWRCLKWLSGNPGQ